MPMLIVDASAWTGDNPPWEALAKHPDVYGCIIKATQGTSYAPNWFVRHWPRVRDVGGTRYGDSWFRGAYHYLDFHVDGAAQADYFLAHVERAGGWGDGDIFPIVDVERSGASNEQASAELVVACVLAFAARVKQKTGRKVILYGRGAMRDLHITSKMGCDVVWNPSYTSEMVTNGLMPPWSLGDIVLWQYTDGKAGGNDALPRNIPGFPSNADISAYVDGASKPSLSSMRRRLTGATSWWLFAGLIGGVLALLGLSRRKGGSVASA